jgi:hypothetical protein
MLDQRLRGISIGSDHGPVLVVAYADGVTVFLTDLQVVEEAIQKSSGARLNPTNSRAYAIGRWRNFHTLRDIDFHTSVTSMVVPFWSTIQQSVTTTWTNLTGKVRTPADESYPRDLFPT